MKTNVNVLVALDTRRPKPDGTFPLILRIILGSTSTQITLNKFFNIKDWDDKARKVKTSYKGTESTVRLNNWINSKKTELSDFIVKLDERKILITLSHAKEIKELFERKDSAMSFFDFMTKKIDQQKAINRIGNARAYQGALNALLNFRDKKPLTFIQLNYSFLLEFEAHHYGKGNSTNGLATYMRAIRAVYNQAIKEGVVDRELYPFLNYSIKTQKTRKRAISIDSIKAIKQLTLEPEHPLYHARNIFMFSFYMRGMPFADMARLRLSNIVNDRIIFDRVKTHKPYNVKIIPEIKELLNIYTVGKNYNDYLFNIIKRTQENDIYKDIHWARSRYNKKLKKIATLCGIEDNLTSYVSRHSFATQAKNLRIPIANISEMLGHGNIKTTEIYLDNLPSDELDNDHERIIENL